jgi:hypothetical protein
MSSELLKRIERLEEELARERASKRVWNVGWIDPETGVWESFGSDRSC